MYVRTYVHPAPQFICTYVRYTLYKQTYICTYIHTYTCIVYNVDTYVHIHIVCFEWQACLVECSVSISCAYVCTYVVTSMCPGMCMCAEMLYCIVCVCVLRCCTALCVYVCIVRRLELLEAEEAEQVCLLVYAQNRTIARTAGEFLCTYYFTEVLIEAAKKMSVPKGTYGTDWEGVLYSMRRWCTVDLYVFMKLLLHQPVCVYVHTVHRQDQTNRE